MSNSSQTFAHKTGRETAAGSSADRPQRSRAAAIAPPACGIDFVDDAPAAPVVGPVLQRRPAPQPQRGATADAMPRARASRLPGPLQAGIEALAGIGMDGVTVHRNSPRPAQVGALAYTQGSDIHLAPGQERHLPHEAWHVVQQAQGRVRPTRQLKRGAAVNDDRGLEREADVMGAKAAAGAAPQPEGGGQRLAPSPAMPQLSATLGTGRALQRMTMKARDRNTLAQRLVGEGLIADADDAALARCIEWAADKREVEIFTADEDSWSVWQSIHALESGAQRKLCDAMRLEVDGGNALLDSARGLLAAQRKTAPVEKPSGPSKQALKAQRQQEEEAAARQRQEDEAEALRARNKRDLQDQRRAKFDAADLVGPPQIQDNVIAKAAWDAAIAAYIEQGACNIGLAQPEAEQDLIDALGAWRDGSNWVQARGEQGRPLKGISRYPAPQDKAAKGSATNSANLVVRAVQANFELYFSKTKGSPNKVNVHIDQV